jgi:antitoxin MazE
MEARIAKWGNSLGLRIPLALVKAIGIKENTMVNLKVKNNEIVVSKTKSYKLNDLLSKITAKNKHHAIDTGNIVGEEVW